MKEFWAKLGFRKMDEMEQQIAFQAQRNALLFLLVALFVWTLAEAYRVYTYGTMLNPLPCCLLASASSIQLISQLILAHRAVKDEPEYTGTSPAVKIAVGLCAVAAVVITVGAVMLIMGYNG